MKLQSLEPFVPSGKDFNVSRQFFLDLGFEQNWSSDDVCELQMGDVKFILQRYENRELQENMISNSNLCSTCCGKSPSG